MIVEGGAGLGKTRLLDECASIATSLSFRVGRGAAEPGRAVLGMEALLDALFEGADPLIPRGALSDAHASREQRFWLLQDIQALIEEAALKGPLLICLDDLHWAGSACAVAMRQLPRNLAALPVCWVLAFRPNQGVLSVQDAKHLLLEAGAELICLEPLERKAVAQVAADILGADPDDQLLQTAKRVHGNPFFLVEFFRGLQDEQLVAVEAGRARLLRDVVPHRVSDGIQDRLARISPAAHRVATLASALGRRFSVHDLAVMTGMPLADLLEPIGELVQAGLFTENEERLTFVHDLLREGVRASLPSPVRRALDRQAADVVLARGALPVEVARQLADSADPGDEVAISTLSQAADALGVTDPAASAELAERALELAPAEHPLRAQLVSRRALSLFAAGLGEQGKRFADTALRQTLPAAEEARVRLSISAMFDLAADVRAENARTALAMPDLPADLRALLWASLFHNLTVAGRTEEAQRLAQRAREAVDAGTTPTASFMLVLAESAVEFQLAHFQRSLELCLLAERGRPKDQEDARGRLAHSYRSWILTALDRFDEAMQVANDGVASAQRDRQNWALHVFETWKGRQLLQMGHLLDAAVALEGRFPVAEAHSIVGVLDAASVVALGELKIHVGDDAGAREVGDIARVMLTARVPVVQSHAAWYLALHAMSVGDATKAHDWLCSRGQQERLEIFPVFPLETADVPQLVRIAVAADDSELAERSVAAAETRAKLNPGVRSLQATPAHARGLWSQSIENLETAVSLFDDSLRPLALASALEDLGRLQVTRGAVEAGVSALDRTLAIHVQAGAAWDAARIRRRLRKLGVRRRMGTSDRPTGGWAALTTAEQAVARLAAEDNTNRQIAEKLFISPHTVNTHLRHVFEKLGINSRVALTRVAGEIASNAVR